MKINIINNIFNNKLNKFISINYFNFYGDLIYNKNYIFGAKINTKNNITFFRPILYKIDQNFNILEKKNIEFKHEKLESYFVRHLYEENDSIILIIENRIISKEEQKINYLKIKLDKNLDIINILDILELEDINKFNNLFYFKNNNQINFISKLEIDEERPDYYWGKYLFYFQDKNKEFYKPIFDKIINYEKDKGHLFHYIEDSKQTINKHEWDFDNDGNCVYKKYFIIFSIRHKYEDEPTKYYYKIYSAYSDDLKYFYDTKEVQIIDNISESKWYCYPEIFKKDNKYYVLMCQDDFGKEKETLLGELIIS